MNAEAKVMVEVAVAGGNEKLAVESTMDIQLFTL